MHPNNRSISRLSALLLVCLAGCAGGHAIGGSRAPDARTGAPLSSPSTPVTTPPAQTPPTTPVTTPGSTSGRSHTLTFVNNCPAAVWVGALTNGKEFALPDQGGWKLEPSAQHDIVLAGHWGGRFWGRTGCTMVAGTLKCDTGDCGGAQCDGRGGQPASLAEFLLYDTAGKDFYDVSLVDGFNLPIAIAPTAGTVPSTGVSGQLCGSPTCAADISAICPEELQQKDALGNVVACFSACSVHHTAQTCCTDAYDKPEMCPPTPLSDVFKNACDDAYSYAYDDKTSTYTCTATAYTITFCPGATAGP